MSTYEILSIFLAAIIATSALLTSVCYAIWFIVKTAIAPIKTEIEQIKNDVSYLKHQNIAEIYVTKADCKEIRQNCPGRMN